LNVLGDREAVFGHVDELVLPHEDAWEFACRGGLGNESAYYWGNKLNGTQANCDGNHPYGTTTTGAYLEGPTAVGEYAEKFPHPWGLCDMHGNVWE
jgi:formylglycine-generating enzyme required for sulfatase activity